VAETKDINFESAVEKLEVIVNKLEQGDATLEEALMDFQEGVALLQLCSKRLNQAEEKMKVLLDENGEIRLAAFAEDGEE